MGKFPQRKTIIYVRVSTPRQKQDLINQIELAENFRIARGWKIDGVYKYVASAFNFDARKDFQALPNEVLSYRIERVMVTYRNRLTRVGFNFFENLFARFGTQIVVINDYVSEGKDIEEVIEEIITILHSFLHEVLFKQKKTQEGGRRYLCYVDVVYECEAKETEPKGNYRAGVDVELDEFLAGVSENSKLRSFIVSGKEIKVPSTHRKR